MASGTDGVGEYVFVPLVNDVNYKYERPNLTLSKNGTTPIKINILGNKHITEITENKNKENKNKVVINNILVLTGYAVDENSLGLVHTLDPCDYVKGILVNGKIEQNGEKKKSEQNPSIQEIIFPKAEVMNKLYFIRKSNVNLHNDIIKINLITESKHVGKTNYRSLKIDKNKIKGIADLYDIHDDKDIDNLVEKLSCIINYYSI
ncbi:MAG: type III-B CRISPR system CMR subunit Cmr7 [Sulfolobaceae archaeon]